jgi:hydrogenase-4 component F
MGAGSSSWLPAALPLWAPVAWPFLAALLLALPLSRPGMAKAAANSGLLASALGFLLGLALLARPEGGDGVMRLDAVNRLLPALGGAVGLLVSGRLATRGEPPGPGLPLAVQVFLGGYQLSVLADGPVLGWIGLVPALLAAAAILSGAGEGRWRAEAVSLCWRMLLPCGAGLATALLGVVVLLLGCGPGAGAVGTGSWPGLTLSASGGEAGLLRLGAMLLLAGYGPLSGLVPWQGWGIAASSRGPAVFSALCLGLLPGMVLPMLWRAGQVTDSAAGSLPLEGILMAAGLLSLLVAALALWRRQEPGRLIGWAGLGQTGLAALCFGLDLPLAGILALAGQALSRGAAGLVLRGGAPRREMAPEPPGGAAALRAGRWGLLLALAGLAGLPPFPGFAAILAVAMALAQRHPVLLLPFGLALALSLPALARQAERLAADLPVASGRHALLPLWGGLALAVLLGLGLAS